MSAKSDFVTAHQTTDEHDSANQHEHRRADAVEQRAAGEIGLEQGSGRSPSWAAPISSAKPRTVELPPVNEDDGHSVRRGSQGDDRIDCRSTEQSKHP